MFNDGFKSKRQFNCPVTWLIYNRQGTEAITETWLEQGQEWLVEVPGYRCFSRSREGGKRGGGVALLIKDTLTAAVRQFEEDLPTEVIWVEVRNRKGAVTLLGRFL